MELIRIIRTSMKYVKLTSLFRSKVIYFGKSFIFIVEIFFQNNRKKITSVIGVRMFIEFAR